MRFYISISGARPLREEYYDTPEAAVKAASNEVYLEPKRICEAIETLKRGKPFAYAYGFVEMHISPIFE